MTTSHDKQRAHVLMASFSDTECRLILERLIETAPREASRAITEHFLAKKEIAKGAEFDRVKDMGRLM